ncbi:5'-nucleotidase domain-containing protein 1-like [Asterias rubens]|uniref:5'-nucleotidase domain-containing protein 1-like n=1 Tax=Asterias rubens TaxID=7604 RepID=UPI0014557CE3|nr:5'-nucleotidase domain-containing protein 1-like [Asterias rubens]
MNSSENGSVFMNIQGFDCVGFDLDHTLCKYKLDNFFSLVYDYFAKTLVENKGYDKRILQPLKTHKDFCVKGLVWDIRHGDFLKLSDAGVILRASHGSRLLSYAEIQQKYGAERLWQHFHCLEETLEQCELYRYYENYFDMPSMVVGAQLVDLEEEKPGGWSASWERVTNDMLQEFRKLFSSHLYQEKLPAILTDCTKHPTQYVERCSPHLKEWLKGLRGERKVVFLLTSSQSDFASDLTEYILGADWKDYFDINLHYARKPGFFKTKDPSERPFFKFDDVEKTEEVTELETGQCYIEGNAKKFNEYLQKVTGKQQPKVHYNYL